MIAHQRPNINDEGVPVVNNRTAWLQTSSGRRVHLPTPSVDEVDIKDIAAALSKQCRFNGHCDDFYSVAQHCVMGVLMARHLGMSLQIQREFLLHDATEAYLGDVIRPVKRELPLYQEMEQTFWGVISKKFGLPEVHSSEVHDLDNYMLVWEKETFLPRSEVWGGLPDISSFEFEENLGSLRSWAWQDAQGEYLLMYEELFGARI